MFIETISLCGLAVLVLHLQLAAAGVEAHETVDNDGRIVGGQKMSIKQVPFLVNIRLYGESICGGSLLNARTVVTAAHCVKGVNKDKLSVTAGSALLRDKTIKRKVRDFVIHEKFDFATKTFDVAIVKLDSDMEGENITPIKLFDGAWNPNTKVSVHGWGLTRENGIKSSDVMGIVVPIISKEECQKKYEKKQKTLTNTMFCASAAGQDSCEGDSGGPAVCESKLCGIVSWGVGCARADFSGVYTNVTVVKDFITEHM